MSTTELSPARGALAMALFAAAILIGALVIQYAYDAEPCQLCVWQRYPHLALVLIGVVGFVFWPRAALLTGGFVALGSAALALYHVGIEQGFWALPANCSAGTDAQSIEELRRVLLEAPPACDQVSFALFGFSLALWNAFASLMLALLAVLALTRAAEPSPRAAPQEQ